MSVDVDLEAGAPPAVQGKQAFDRTKATYVFAAVRRDLPLATQCVQLCHATSQASAKGGLLEDTRFVLVSVPDKHALLELAQRLEMEGVVFSLFEEPDYGVGPSALATHQSGFQAGRRFSRFPLWSA